VHALIALLHRVVGLTMTFTKMLQMVEKSFDLPTADLQAGAKHVLARLKEYSVL
jgi:hypothetical protein